MTKLLNLRSGLLAAALLGSLCIVPEADAMGGGHGGFGGGGHVGGGFGRHGPERLHIPGARTEAFTGQFGGGYRGYGGYPGYGRYPGYGGYVGYGYGPFGFNDGRGFHRGFGYGQNGDGLSDYAPYGRPVDGCDPTTPSRAHPGCGFGAPIR